MQDTSVVSKSVFRRSITDQMAHLKKLPVLVAIFIIGFVTPMLLTLGPIRLSVYRIILLAMFLPMLFALLSGKAGRIRVPDICVILICIWSTVSLIAVHGFADKVETIGILFVETLGAWTIGRVLIRTPEAFRSMVKLFFGLTLVVIPFVVFETLTGQNIILDIFDKIGRTYPDVPKDSRWGLDRVQGPFAHPIHFGVFFGSLVGITYYVLGYGKSMFGRVSQTVIVILIGALALSSGPLAALVAQVFFISWDLIFRRFKSRWYILGGLTVLAYILIDILSTRNPFQVFISYLAFNENTAYNRILIWEWGIKNIFDNPLLGIGFNSWERPYWMSDSFDMFWLLLAMRHGVVVGFLLFLLFFWVFFKAAYAKISDPKIQAYRTGYLATMAGLFMAGWTVHYWDATLVLFIFLLSSGVWITDQDAPQPLQADPSSDKEAATQPGTRYSRFGTDHQRS